MESMILFWGMLGAKGSGIRIEQKGFSMKRAIRMKKGHLFSIFLFCVSVLFAASSVHAYSFSESRAQLSISSISVSSPDGVQLFFDTILTDWGGQIQVYNNLGESVGPIFSGNPTGSVTGASAEVVTPTVDPDLLSGHALADLSTPGLQAAAKVLGEIGVGTNYERAYYYSGVGTIQISIDYLLELEMTSDAPGDLASGFAEAALKVLYNNDSFGDPAEDILVSTGIYYPTR